MAKLNPINVYSSSCDFEQLSLLSASNYPISSVLSLQNNPKNLDPSLKTDLDFWDCLGRVKLVLQQNSLTDLVICSHCREGEKPCLQLK